MPHQLEAFRIANQAKISKRPLILAILLTTVISLLVSFLIEVSVYYKIGANSGSFGSFALLGDHYFGWLHNSLVYATTQDNMSILFTGIGLLSSIFIAAMRARFIWWPFHPLGLIMAGNDEMEDLWLPIFLCWVLKRLVLKHGGHRAYRRAIPFFLGLALGDFALGSMWSILSILFNHRMYQYFP